MEGKNTLIHNYKAIYREREQKTEIRLCDNAPRDTEPPKAANSMRA